jgi:hypothetical protein
MIAGALKSVAISWRSAREHAGRQGRALDIVELFPDFDSALAVCGGGWDDAALAEVVAYRTAQAIREFGAPSIIPPDNMTATLLAVAATKVFADRQIRIIDVGGGVRAALFPCARILACLIPMGGRRDASNRIQSRRILRRVPQFSSQRRRRHSSPRRCGSDPHLGVASIRAAPAGDVGSITGDWRPEHPTHALAPLG